MRLIAVGCSSCTFLSVHLCRVALQEYVLGQWSGHLYLVQGLMRPSFLNDMQGEQAGACTQQSVHGRMRWAWGGEHM